MLFVLAHVAFLLAWAVLARIVGGALLDVLGIWLDDPVERASTAVMLGVGAVGQLVFGLGLLGWLTPIPVFGTLVGVGVLALATSPSSRGALAEEGAALRGLGIGRGLAALVVLAPVVVLALYPPTGFDAGTYHLPFADRFVDAGAIVRVDGLRFPVFPQLAEMGFVVAMLALDDVAARLTQIVPLVAVAGLLVAWGRRHDRATVGQWAAAFWLGTPLALRIATQAYVDVTLAGFVFLACVAAERWWFGRDDRWLAVAAMALGFGLATKYLAYFFLGALGLLVLGRAVRSRTLRPFLVSGLALAITAGPWVGRLVIETGSPVFPFYASIFGETEWLLPYERHPPPELPVVERWTERLTFLARTPWATLLDRQVFGFQAPLSPWILGLLPIAAPMLWLTRRSRRRLTPHAVLVAAYAVFWVSGFYRDLRFLLPVMPSLGLLLTTGLDALWRRWPRRLTPPSILVALALLLPGWAYVVLEVIERGPIPTDDAARGRFLDRRLPGHRLLADALTLDLPGSIYGLHTENLLHHGDGRLIGDWMGPHRFDKLYDSWSATDGEASAIAFTTTLRSMGAGALLVREDVLAVGLPIAAPSFQRCFERIADETHPLGGSFVLYQLDPSCR